MTCDFSLSRSRTLPSAGTQSLLLAAALLGCGDGVPDRPATELEGAQSAIQRPARSAAAWEMAGHDPQASHFNAAETQIGVANAAMLQTKWRFDAFDGADLGALHGTPVVTDRAIYVGSNTGRFFALSLEGQLLYTHEPVVAAMPQTTERSQAGS